MDPTKTIWAIVGALCCWPALTFGLGIALAIGIQRGWIRNPIDPEKIRKLNYRRNQ